MEFYSLRIQEFLHKVFFSKYFFSFFFFLPTLHKSFIQRVEDFFSFSRNISFFRNFFVFLKASLAQNFWHFFGKNDKNLFKRRFFFFKYSSFYDLKFSKFFYSNSSFMDFCSRLSYGSFFFKKIFLLQKSFNKHFSRK